MLAEAKDCHKAILLSHGITPSCSSSSSEDEAADEYYSDVSSDSCTAPEMSQSSVPLGTGCEQ